LITFDYLLNQIRLHKKSIVIANIIAIFLTIISVPIPLFIPFLVDEVLLGKEGKFTTTINQFIEVSSPEYYNSSFDFGWYIYCFTISKCINYFGIEPFGC